MTRDSILKFCKKKRYFIIVPLICMIAALSIYLSIQRRTVKEIPMDLEMENYGDSEYYYHVLRDCTSEGIVVLEEGYYESVPVKNTTQRFMIPIDPETFERLPSDKICEGTRMEIEGKNYVVHVDSNSEYSVELLAEE